MLSKLYFFLKDKAEKIESRLAEVIIQNQAQPSQEKMFTFGLIFTNLNLAFINILADILKFFIILFSRSEHGFNVLFKQKELRSCPYSYHNYKQVRQKIRSFSFSTLAVLIIATGIASLVLNVWFGGSLAGRAATYGWLQSDWSGGASTTATANHTLNQENWTHYFSKDANVAVDADSISLSASQGAWTDTSDADFNAGTTTNTSVANGTVKLQKPNGATCTTDGDCTGRWCYIGVCTAPPANWQLVENACKVGGGLTGSQLLVYNADLGQYTWSTGGSCLSPQCSGNTLVADNSVDFSAYAARNACKAVGGRLPNTAELSCVIYAKRSMYAGAFTNTGYWSAVQSTANDACIVYYSDGASACGAGKGGNFRVRCVLGQ